MRQFSMRSLKISTLGKRNTTSLGKNTFQNELRFVDQKKIGKQFMCVLIIPKCIFFIGRRLRIRLFVLIVFKI